ncbi:hypothetical protein EW146_g4793 [Bondarzewia mesenterica]|uniref:Integrase catalytic domain-containing protein n=1 Tax=Bondarzewia mesenterica TaxID=1095465 RepID=A0A4S4LTG2_9AGAM|nr:hypothetical protein EW146_g4793 [Bondarzewia mesenterica]
MDDAIDNTVDAHIYKAYSKISKADLSTWHCHFTYININGVLRLILKGMADEIEVTGLKSRKTVKNCVPCLKAKQMRAKISKVTQSPKLKKVLECIYSDVCDPIQTRSHQGFNGFVTWINEASSYVYIDGISHKNQVQKLLPEYLTKVELETGEKVKVLRINGKGEYIDDTMQDYLKLKGVKHEMMMPDTP